MAFEHAAYGYLAGFVGLALLLLGAIMALWPPLVRKPTPPSLDDFPPRPPDNEL
jgi:hypothetical protein